MSGNLGDTNRLRWKGLVWDGDVTQLYYMRNRWYDPQTGRFVSEDPLGLEGGINEYAFAGANPVGGSDPLGLDCTPVKGKNSCQLPPINVVCGVVCQVMTGSLGESGPPLGPWYSPGIGFSGPGGGGPGQPAPAPAPPQLAHPDAPMCGAAIAMAGVTVTGDLIVLGTLGAASFAAIGARGLARYAARAGAQRGGGAAAVATMRAVRQVRAFAGGMAGTAQNTWMGGIAETRATGLAMGDLSYKDFIPVWGSIRAIDQVIGACR